MIEVYQKEIEKLDEMIARGVQQEAALRLAANGWKADADGMKIRNGNKGVSDTADRERKYKMYEDYIREANQIAQEVEDWRSLRRQQMNLKESAQVTENDISNQLAKDGYTRETLAIKERANATNTLKMGDEMVKRAAIDNKAKNNQVILITSVVAIVIIIASVVAWKKFKSKTKK